MTVALACLILMSPFVLAAVLSRAAHRSGSLRLQKEQFVPASPMRGRLSGDDPDARRLEHDLAAIRSRFEKNPSWPASGPLGERR